MRQAARHARAARQSSRCASSTGQASSSTTHFGDRTVPTEEKAGLVKGVFSSVANNYDLMNDLMSGGSHAAKLSAILNAISPVPPATSKQRGA